MTDPIQESPFKGKTGLRRLINATGYSIDGLAAAWRHESAFRQVCLLALIGIGITVFLPMPAWGRGLIVFAHLLSVIVELFNSAIEAAVDHTSLEHHPLAKRAKDLGSAAQFISLLNMSAIWICTLMELI
ncbi:diacylglycerol kinase [Chitinimonas sp. BJB300]|uniref:diacylglycerol kinase n=1 Tax=Chitinimonas sp. BJB300 TaxID=1559339 RepID=UPI000C11C079|nr:diacylglycerol kinase [Chitinimonas sp. BJB300]PHV10745.1 diacylglycerol kinase [Chitinimonas sp. BJB300]TSJ91245.1 diacylglycerol kinase [Chitinimonas sp. BJB300]